MMLIYLLFSLTQYSFYKEPRK